MFAFSPITSILAENSSPKRFCNNFSPVYAIISVTIRWVKTWNTPSFFYAATHSIQRGFSPWFPPFQYLWATWNFVFFRGFLRFFISRFLFEISFASYQNASLVLHLLCFQLQHPFDSNSHSLSEASAASSTLLSSITSLYLTSSTSSTSLSHFLSSVLQFHRVTHTLLSQISPTDIALLIQWIHSWSGEQTVRNEALSAIRSFLKLGDFPTNLLLSLIQWAVAQMQSHVVVSTELLRVFLERFRSLLDDASRLEGLLFLQWSANLRAVVHVCRSASETLCRRLLSIAGCFDHAHAGLSALLALDFGRVGFLSMVCESLRDHKSVTIRRNAEETSSSDSNDSAKPFRWSAVRFDIW